MRESRDVHISIVNTVEFTNDVSVCVRKNWLPKIWVLLLGLPQKDFPFVFHFCFLLLH